MKIAVTALLLLAASASHAQVHKCVDAAGRVSYTETPCTAAAKQSQQMMGREATSTYDPYARERTMQSYERATAISRSINDSAAPSGSGAGIIDSDPNQRIRAQDERNLQRRMAQIEADRRARENRAARAEQAGVRAAQGAAFPKKLARCDGAYCYDTTGGSYLKNADGTLVQSGGGICRPVPGLQGQFNCN